MKRSKMWLPLIALFTLLVLLLGCSQPAPQPVSPALNPATESPTSSPIPAARAAEKQEPSGLSAEQAATLSSLEKVTDYPLYTMQYNGAYQDNASASAVEQQVGAWGCSLFAALGEADNLLYGRNFDWEYSPALLLYTDPPDGYASAAMVDLAYLFDSRAEVQNLTAVPLAERVPLLEAPTWPFDGINEMGLAVGMAAVPSEGGMQNDPEKETIYSLWVIREMLDHAADVEGAVDLMGSYNIKFGGPPLHYLLADASGRSALVEFYKGEMRVTYNEQPWQMVTNFLCAEEGKCTEGKGWRYDIISRKLADSHGLLTTEEALDLLSDVSQANTQWSILYGISTGERHVTMGREYEEIHRLFLETDE